MSKADDDAFRAFAVARRAVMRQTAYLLCGDWHQADDLVQTTLIKLYVAWHRVRSEAELNAYTRRILTRCFLDERRRPWRREAPVDRLADRAAPTSSTDDVLDVRAALARLPGRQRATIVLRFWSGASVSETADALGCSEGTVKSQSARAIATLRGLLAEPALVHEETQ
jgi:RNA polymerase sigma-70 factor (sigma-E family)